MITRQYIQFDLEELSEEDKGKIARFLEKRGAKNIEMGDCVNVEEEPCRLTP